MQSRCIFQFSKASYFSPNLGLQMTARLERRDASIPFSANLRFKCLQSSFPKSDARWKRISPEECREWNLDFFLVLTLQHSNLWSHGWWKFAPSWTCLIYFSEKVGLQIRQYAFSFQTLESCVAWRRWLLAEFFITICSAEEARQGRGYQNRSRLTPD